MSKLTVLSYKNDVLVLDVHMKRPHVTVGQMVANGQSLPWHTFWNILVLLVKDSNADAQVLQFYKQDTSENKSLAGKATLENEFGVWTLSKCRVVNYQNNKISLVFDNAVHTEKVVKKNKK